MGGGLLFLKNVKLFQFRNYESLELHFNSDLIVFVGKNAQGKTNILESIFLCCTGRSHRTPKDKELIQWDKGSGYVRTEVAREDGMHQIEILFQRQEKKMIKINGIQAQRLGELMGHLNGVMFSPEDLRLVKEGPIERRRFMDMELSQMKPQYFYSLQQYNRILLQRNNLLKEVARKPSLRKTISVWNEQLVILGTRIIKERKGFIDRLSKIAKDIHAHISTDREELEIIYHNPIQGDHKETIQRNFMASLEKGLEGDLRRGNTSTGPHRDDILLRINGIDVRSFGSQGQQRTTALSLKLSELELMKKETGKYPVLLLDDVMSELDGERQRMLLDNIRGIQTLITCTDIESIHQIADREKEVYEVKKGKVRKRHL
jgi:DNA replication and repair protein RecF